MSRVRVQIMNQFERKSHEYKTIKRYWKLIQQDSRKLSNKRFYRPTFRMHLTNKEILDKLLSYSEDLKHHYNLYQLLLFHFQNKEPDKFFGLIEDNLKQVHPLFQTVFKTFLKDKEKIVNALQLHYSNAKLEMTNNLIKLIKRNTFGFRNFENFKKRIFIALNIKKEKVWDKSPLACKKSNGFELHPKKVEIPILLFHNKLITCLACKGLTCFENDLVFEVTVNGIW